MENIIKQTSNNYFKKKEYSKAIDSLCELGITRFIDHLQKHKWLGESQVCTELQKRDEIFAQICESEVAAEVLHDYFRQPVFLPEFEEKLANEFPELFVKCVQVNHSFLDATKLELYSKLLLPEYLEIHRKIWNHIQRIESNHWRNITEDLNRLLKQPDFSLENILIETVIWLEQSRFEIQEQSFQYHLSSVYNTFINLFLHTYSKEKELKIASKNEFIKLFFEKLNNDSIGIELQFILKNVGLWVNFRDSIIHPYCYDQTIKPKCENGIIYFNRTPKSYYKWELDGVRYQLNKQNYFNKAVELVEYQIEHEELEIPKGEKAEDEDMNYMLAIQQWQQIAFLADLKISSFVIGGNKVPVSLLFTPLLTFTINRKSRYEHSLHKYFNGSKSWNEAFLKLSIESYQDHIERFPFIMMTKHEYIELNNLALKEIPKDSAKDVIELFSYQINPDYDFDRFNINYDVWKKPFIKVGNHLFCPMLFFASNDWFYAFAQSGIENLSKKNAWGERKISATEMEKHLGEIIEQKKWDVKVFDDKDAGKIYGDIDIAVNDGNHTLLIQLKRTKFRLNLKDAFFESILTDRKATKQLNQGEKSLSPKNDLFELNKSVHKWIVSTSYENVLTEIDDCLKINYFDLINALDNPQIKRLDQLINYCKNDEGLLKWSQELANPDVPDEYKLVIMSTGFPLPLVQPIKYSQPLFSDDDRFIEYNHKYNKALELGDKGDREKAIQILKTCVAENPNDYQAWEAMGNYYADLGYFNQSFECFEKALEIIPDDPYILRNCSIAEGESGNMDKWRKLVTCLKNDFWFIDLQLMM